MNAIPLSTVRSRFLGLLFAGAGLAGLALSASPVVAAPAMDTPEFFVATGTPVPDVRFLTPESDGRPGLAGAVASNRIEQAWSFEDGASTGTNQRSLSPFLAGLMSAVIPGSGQLALGARRGWMYLGVETISGFAVWALREAGRQGEDDFESFADGHWAWDRYETVATCEDGGGPIDLEGEMAVLLDLFENDRDAFYDDIGDQKIYACGWDESASRTEYGAMRRRSDSLFRSARAFTTVLFFNHIVSAIDAAKSAANRRSRERRALGFEVAPGHDGSLAMRLTLHERF